MTTDSRWTPDHLQSPADRDIHLQQRRAQLHPIVDDLRRVAREMEAATREVGAIEGDMPGQARIRAWHVTRPLFKAADDIEAALADLVAFNARYRRSYEELPERREDKRRRKEIAKGQGQAAIESPTTADDGGDRGPFGDVIRDLRKGA